MKVILHNARQAYMTFFEAKSIKNSDPTFSGTFIIDEATKISVPDMGFKLAEPTKLKEVCERVIKDKFSRTTNKDKNWAWNKADGSTTRDKYVDDAGDYHDGFTSETYYVSAKKFPGQIAPSKCKQFSAGELYVVDQRKDRINAQDGLLAPGDRVSVVLDFYAFDADGTKGVTASLEGVQLKAKSEPLKLGGARINAGDDFEEEEIDTDDASDLM